MGGILPEQCTSCSEKTCWNTSCSESTDCSVIASQPEVCIYWRLLVVVFQNAWIMDQKSSNKILGLNRDLNPGPPAPEAGIIPLDHWALYGTYVARILNGNPFTNNSATPCLASYIVPFKVRWGVQWRQHAGDFLTLRNRHIIAWAAKTDKLVVYPLAFPLFGSKLQHFHSPASQSPPKVNPIDSVVKTWV